MNNYSAPTCAGGKFAHQTFWRKDMDLILIVLVLVLLFGGGGYWDIGGGDKNGLYLLAYAAPSHL
jgi:hypothetical protein